MKSEKKAEIQKTKNITKNDLADGILDNMNIDEDRQTVLKIVDALLNEIKENLAEGNSIELRGFGTFEPKLRKGRENARNPKTGESISFEQHYTACFRAGQDLKDKLKKLK